jgi:hypothetical protein
MKYTLAALLIGVLVLSGCMEAPPKCPFCGADKHPGSTIKKYVCGTECTEGTDGGKAVLIWTMSSACAIRQQTQAMLRAGISEITNTTGK